MFYSPNKYQKRQKALIDQELAIYRREQQLAIDKNIQERKENNWGDVDKARRANRDEQVKLNKEIALLIAQRDALKEQREKEISMLQEQVKLLKDLLINAMNALQKTNITNITTPNG